MSEVDLDPLTIFHKAVANAKPIMGTTTIRRGGKRYHVMIVVFMVQPTLTSSTNYMHERSNLSVLAQQYNTVQSVAQ